MIPAYADDHRGRGVEGVSIVLSSLGAGAVLSAIWLAYHGASVVSLRRIYQAFFVFIIAGGGNGIHLRKTPIHLRVLLFADAQTPAQ